MLEKVIAFFAELWYVLWLPRKELIPSMAKKRANGEGSIRKRADGRWEGRYTAGFKLALGIATELEADFCNASIPERL